MSCGAAAVSPLEWVLTALSFRPTLGYPLGPLPLPVAPPQSFRASPVCRLRFIHVGPPLTRKSTVFCLSKYGQPTTKVVSQGLDTHHQARRRWHYMLCRVFRSVCFSFLVPCLSSDPFASRGNWAVDLQAGSDFGYKLLFVVLLAGIIAVILQVTFFVSIPRC